MNNYFFKFTATGNVDWLDQKTFQDAFTYVERRYGKSWRDLGQIYAYQAIAA